MNFCAGSPATASAITRATAWTFEPVDSAVFPAIDLARQAVAVSATHPAVLNAANEVAVAAFLAGRCGFPAIVDTVRRVVEEHRDGSADTTLDQVLAAERRGRVRAAELLAG